MPEPIARRPTTVGGISGRRPSKHQRPGDWTCSCGGGRRTIGIRWSFTNREGSSLISPVDLRTAHAHDADALTRVSSGPIAGKRPFIVESLARRDVVVACVGEQVAGYIIWDRAFFGRPFVWLLGVDRAFRRRGIAARLMRTFLERFPHESVFTSTNESNGAMQALLIQLDFKLTGRVENLDPGDPELFFYRPGRPTVKTS